MKLIRNQHTRQVWSIIGLLTGIGLLLRFVYRPYAYRHHLVDGGVADNTPNFLSGVVIVLLYFTYNEYRPRAFARHAVLTLVGLAVYELLQGRGLLYYRTFDPRDLMATAIGVGVGYASGRLLYQNCQQNKNP
jgi:hypothetical protein